MSSLLSRTGAGRRSAVLVAIAVAAALAVLPSGTVRAAATGNGYSVSLIAAGQLPAGVAVDPGTDTVYVANAAAKYLTVINGGTSKVSATISLAGIARSLAVDTATDTVYTLEGAATGSTTAAIEVINGATGAVTATITVPAAATAFGAFAGIAVDEATDTVYAASGRGVSVINGTTNTVTATVSTGLSSRPAGLAVDPSSDVVWVADESGSVLAIDGKTNALAHTVSLGSSEPVSVAVDPMTDIIYAADIRNKDVAVIDGSTGAVTTTIAVGSANSGIVADPGTDTIYATTAGGYFGASLGDTWVINGASNVVTDTLPRGGLGIAVDQATGTVYAPAYTRLNAVWVMTPSVSDAWSPIITSTGIPTFGAGLEGNFAVAASALPAATFREAGALPAGLTFYPDGTLAGKPPANSGGSYPITISAANGVSPGDTLPFDLVILQAPAIASAASTTFKVGKAASFSIQVTGYPAPSVSEHGRLPKGVTFAQSGLGWHLSGWYGGPAGRSGGVYRISISAYNGYGNAATQKFTLTVNQPPAFASAPHVTFRAGRKDTFSFATTGFPAPRLSERGTLPKGVRFVLRRNGTSALTGEPGRSDRGRTFQITVFARSGVWPAARQTFRLTVS